ncbi:MAG: response regulator transcription factor [Flavobacteriaceae bacterium]|nr:response regulator transcription factor [Flavobacteriaceae bacterium]
MNKIKIIIVDDHMLFSEALKSLIEDNEAFKIITQLSNGKELQDYCTTCTEPPDIILMDVQMPIVNGIEATQWLKENHPKIKVLALTMEDDELTILKMIRAGAKGYLLKDIHSSVLHNAIEETFSRGFYYTEQVSNTLVHALKIEANPLEKIDLKDKELELLKYVTQELTYKEISKKMFLSPKTIDGYRDKLFTKLNVKSRIGLVIYAIKEGLLDDN